MSEKAFHELLVRTIGLYKERRWLDEELEKSKEAIRQHSAGEKRKFSIPGLGKILIAAKRVEGFDVDSKNLNNLNPKQLYWLLANNVLRCSLNMVAFKSLDQKTKNGILNTGCVKKIEYEDGHFRQSVFIRVDGGEDICKIGSVHDSSLPKSQIVNSHQKAGGETDDFDDDFDEEDSDSGEEADLIIRDLHDDIEEFARSNEDGWPYDDE